MFLFCFFLLCFRKKVFVLRVAFFLFRKEEEVKPIKHLVRSHVRNAALLSNVGAEISFQLPNDASASFQGMLTEIDERKAELKINRCGRCVAECVFVFSCLVFSCFVLVPCLVVFFPFFHISFAFFPISFSFVFFSFC